MNKIVLAASVAALAAISSTASAWWANPPAMDTAMQEEMRQDANRHAAEQAKMFAEWQTAMREAAQPPAMEMDRAYPMPEMPAFGQMPEFPAFPDFAQMPEFPAMPEFGQMPEFPAMPEFGQAPDFPAMPEFGQMPEFPAFPEFAAAPAMPDYPAPVHGQGRPAHPFAAKQAERRQHMDTRRDEMRKAAETRRAEAIKASQERRASFGNRTCPKA